MQAAGHVPVVEGLVIEDLEASCIVITPESVMSRYEFRYKPQPLTRTKCVICYRKTPSLGPQAVLET